MQFFSILIQANNALRDCIMSSPLPSPSYLLITTSNHSGLHLELYITPQTTNKQSNKVTYTSFVCLLARNCCMHNRLLTSEHRPQ